MPTEKLHRLDAHNIKSPLLRAELYKEIRDNQNNPEWRQYEILPSEVLTPEFIAFKFYGNDLEVLKWIIVIAAGLEDYRLPLEAGAVIRLPGAVWIRQRIQYYMGIDS